MTEHQNGTHRSMFHSVCCLFYDMFHDVFINGLLTFTLISLCVSIVVVVVVVNLKGNVCGDVSFVVLDLSLFVWSSSLICQITKVPKAPTPCIIYGF